MKPMKETSTAYKKEAANLALSFVTIKQCKDCGHPTLYGYCCPHCGSDNPTTNEQEPSWVEI